MEVVSSYCGGYLYVPTLQRSQPSAHVQHSLSKTHLGIYITAGPCLGRRQNYVARVNILSFSLAGHASFSTKQSIFSINGITVICQPTTIIYMNKSTSMAKETANDFVPHCPIIAKPGVYLHRDSSLLQAGGNYIGRQRIHDHLQNAPHHNSPRRGPCPLSDGCLRPRPAPKHLLRLPRNRHNR